SSTFRLCSGTPSGISRPKIPSTVGSARSRMPASTRTSFASGRSCEGRTRVCPWRRTRPRRRRRSSGWCGRSSRGSTQPRRRFPAVREHRDFDGHLGGGLRDGLDLIDEHRSVRAERRGEHHLDLGLFGSERHLADRKSTRLNSSHVAISYAVFCLKKKQTTK